MKLMFLAQQQIIKFPLSNEIPTTTDLILKLLPFLTNVQLPRTNSRVANEQLQVILSFKLRHHNQIASVYFPRST